MASIIVLVILTVLKALILVNGAKPLPKYITGCNRNDPDLDECAVKSASAAVAYLVKGDPDYKIPNLLPLKVPKLELQSGNNLKLNLKDISVFGIETAKFTNSKYDLKVRHVMMSCHIPWISIDSQYTVKGSILILPISGSGSANLTFYDNDYTYAFNYDLIKKEDGKEYISITNSSTKIKIAKGYFHLENLFNGNKVLGDHMNNFLNENSEQVVKDIGIPVITELVQVVITQVLKAILNVVPYDDVLLK